MKATFRGSRSPHLTAKKVYTVLEVSGGFLRVIDDGGAPALVPSAGWEIKAQPIANGWHMDLRDGASRWARRHSWRLASLNGCLTGTRPPARHSSSLPQHGVPAWKWPDSVGGSARSDAKRDEHHGGGGHVLRPLHMSHGR